MRPLSIAASNGHCQQCENQYSLHEHIACVHCLYFETLAEFSV